MLKPVRSFSFFAGLLFLLLLSVPLASASQTTFTLTFSSGDLRFEKLQGFDKVVLDRCQLRGNPGDPLLPVRYVQIAIPPDMEVVSVRANSLDRLELPGSYDIIPAQEPRPLMDLPWKGQKPQLTSPNPQVYGLSSEFPGKTVEVLSHGFLAGQHIAGLAIYPLQYIPSQGRLILTSQIEIALILRAVGAQSVPVFNRTNSQAQLYERTVKGLVLNPGDVKFEARGGSKQSNVRYLIVTDTLLVSVFGQLADWKTKKGVPAEVVTTQWIYSNYPGEDNQQQIRNCIKDYYQSHGTTWALLGGDTDLLPHRLTWVLESGVGHYPWEDDIPSDLYYSDLDGDWDWDDDGIYGEFEDIVDLYPDLFVGRAPVSTYAQAQDFVNKTIAYDSNPPTDYQNKMLLAGEYLWPQCDGGVLKDYIYDNYVTPLFPQVTRLYESLGNLTWENFRAALNSGQAVTNHAGHANYYGLSLGPDSWGRSDMDNLTNGSRQGIFYTYGCISAGIDFDCVGERFVQNPNGGGFAYFGNSRYGWGNSSDPLQGVGVEFDKQFFRALFTSNSHRAGRTLSDSKLAFIPAAQDPSGSGPWIRWTMLQLLLLGDPEAFIHTDAPLALEVGYPDSTGVGLQTISVHVEMEGTPLQTALVCLSKENEIYERLYTSSSGWVSFEVEPYAPGEISVVVTYDGAAPHVGTIAVDDEGPFAPLPFDLISPGDGDTTWNDQSTLVWEEAEDIDVGDVVTYHLHYSYFSPSEGLVEDSVTGLSDTTYLLSDLSDDQVYFWKVRATDTNGLLRWSNDEYSLRTYVPDPPQGFALIYPPDLDTLWDETADFIWHPSQDPDPGDVITYALFFSTDSLFLQKDSIQGIQDTSQAAPGLQDHQGYFWKVKAVDRFGLAAWSTEILRFVTYYPDPPSPFGLIYPSNGTSLSNQDTVTLLWEPAQDPDPTDLVSYTLELSTSPVFRPESTLVIDNLTQTSCLVNDLLAGGAFTCYYWRVKAFDRFDLITWCDEIFSFEASTYLSGDANGDQLLDLADVVFLINYLYKSGTAPSPLQAGDASCDGKIDLADVVYVINYLFKEGPHPCYP